MPVDACLTFDAGINGHVRIGEMLNAHAETDEELNDQRVRTKDGQHEISASTRKNSKLLTGLV
eukprot:11185195-Lingulodinium_polyedra.AAC.1